MESLRIIKITCGELEGTSEIIDCKNKKPEDIYEIFSTMINVDNLASIVFPKILPTMNYFIFVDADMFTKDNKYNFSILGDPIFGDCIIVECNENGGIISMNDTSFGIINDTIKFFKEEEQKNGTFGNMNKMNLEEKKEFYKHINDEYDEDMGEE